MLVLYILVSTGHPQGGHLQRNTFATNAEKRYAYMDLISRIINYQEL